MDLKTIALIIGIASPLVGASAYAMKYYADNEYIRQDAWIQEKERDRQIEIKEKIDELEWTKENERPLTKKESWQLKRYKSNLK